MSTIDGPLGAAPHGTTHDLQAPARTQTTRVSLNAGHLGLASVLTSGLLLCLAAVDTGTLLPESISIVNTPGERALAGPLVHLGIHLRSGEIIGALTLMFIGYVLVLRNAHRLSPRLVLTTIAAFIAIVVIAPPLFSTDLFSYQEYARIFFGLHLNPYTHDSRVLQLAPGFADPLSNYIGAKWIHTPTVYGPIFTLLSGLFANTSNTDAIAFSAFAYKAIAALSCGGIIYMIWKSARLRGLNPVRGAVLFGLNPLVVLYGIGGGHNDLLMLVCSTGGIWALLSRHERSSGVLAVVSAGIKLTGGLILPFALVANPGPGAGPRRRRVLFGAAVAAILTVGVGLSVFGAGMTNMFHTLSQVQGEGGWQSLPGFLSSALHLETASHVISLLFGVAFVGICLRLLWRVWSDQLDWLDAAAWATFWLLMASSSILPWYISWLLVPVALCANRRLWSVAIWFTGWVQLTTMVAYLPHGNILSI